MSGGWSLTGVTVMLNLSVTARPLADRPGGDTSDDRREADGAELYGCEGGKGESNENAGEVESCEGATQARKVKLSFVVSESSWMYVMPNRLSVT